MNSRRAIQQVNKRDRSGPKRNENEPGGGESNHGAEYQEATYQCSHRRPSPQRTTGGLLGGGLGWGRKLLPGLLYYEA